MPPPAATGPLPGHITLAHVLWDTTTKVGFAIVLMPLNCHIIASSEGLLAVA